MRWFLVFATAVFSSCLAAPLTANAAPAPPSATRPATTGAGRATPPAAQPNAQRKNAGANQNAGANKKTGANKNAGTHKNAGTNGTPPKKPGTDQPPATLRQASWVAWALGAAGAAVALVLIGLAWRAFASKSAEPTGPAIVAALPVLAALGFAIIPFAPMLGEGRWVPVEVLAAGVLLGGGFLGFLYGLPVVDPDALKTYGAAAGTFVRPGTKLEKVTDGIVSAFTGGILVYALTQGARFNDFFVRQLGLSGATNLLGAGILFFFGPIGFMLGYCVTATVGALGFKRVQETLVAAASIVQSIELLPDLPISAPTPEQLAAASDIAKRPYSSLTGAAEKAAWARAKTVLERYGEALPAYQDAIILDPNNAGLLIDYATTIYNDPSTNDIPSVLQLLARASALTGGNASPALRQRNYALTAAAQLYLPGGYEDAIITVNEWIANGQQAPTSWHTRFYRACGFGQLYESFAAVTPPARPPYVTALQAPDLARLQALVRNDVAITLAAAPGQGLERVRMVMDPTSPARQNLADDDLQMLAADFPPICQDVGITVPPPPAPDPPPALPRPARPTTIPDPVALTAPGALQTWIDLNCRP
ncbi:MAG TPA: hypothetical protein VE826_08235 [Dongiaceae bacterium]|nr:hypothetical protein [Dongiaceae bacterium]